MTTVASFLAAIHTASEAGLHPRSVVMSPADFAELRYDIEEASDLGGPVPGATALPDGAAGMLFGVVIYQEPGQ